MPHHLAIDGVGARHGGAATVLCDLVEAALSHPAIVRVTTFASPANERRFEFPADERLSIVEPRGTSGRLERLAWLEVGFARAARRAGATHLVALGGGGVGHGIPTAVLVQRPQPFSETYARSAGVLERLRATTLTRTLEHATRRAVTVVVQTPTMRRLVAARLRVPDEKLLLSEPAPPRLPHHGGPSPLLDRMRAAPGPRLLYVGSDTAYKDIPTLRRAAWLVRTAHPDTSLFATIRTSRESPESPLVDLGYLPPDALREAYELADVVLLASREETVGFPLLEAMDAGRPVVVADLPYAHDVCGDAALYFPPGDARAAADAIHRLLTDDTLRADVVRRGTAIVQARRAARPSVQLLDALFATGH